MSIQKVKLTAKLTSLILKIVLETVSWMWLKIFSCLWVHGFSGPVFWLILWPFTVALYEKYWASLGNLRENGFDKCILLINLLIQKLKLTAKVSSPRRCTSYRNQMCCIWNYWFLYEMQHWTTVKENKSCKQELFYYFYCFLNWIILVCF